MQKLLVGKERSTSQDIYLSSEVGQGSTFISGRTGSGKTVLLQSLFLQAIRQTDQKIVWLDGI